MADLVEDKEWRFLNGGGEAGAAMRQHDWTVSALGPPEAWPASLRIAVRLMLNTRHPVFIFWGRASYCLFNDSFGRSIGAERRAKALGRPGQEVWEEIWDVIAPQIDQVLMGRGATWHENQLVPITRDGKLDQVYWTYSYSPIDDDTAANGVGGVLVIATETTEQIEAARRLAAERDRIFEMSRDLIAVATFDGHLKWINPAWSRHLRHPHDFLLATPFAEIIHPDDLAVTGEVVAALQRGEPVHQFQVRLLKADGSAIPFAWSAVPEMTPGSRDFYTVGRDISDDLRREEAVRQSQKMEAVGRLTGGLAHDFNNLLQALHGNLDLIRRRPHDPDRVARLADNGLQAAERGVKLTAQLLAFSRAQKLELRPTAVATLIAGMNDLLRTSLGPLIRVSLDTSDDLGVLADPTQLEMALLNLAINARDAMIDGGDLTIATRERTLAEDPELPPGRYVEIRVSDTGTGMPEAVAARAFDPFFTTKAVGKGTGLGLSQVYGMARQAGGTARIESRESRGTSVVVLLKWIDATASAGHSEEDRTGPGFAQTKTVLVIDDDPDVRRFLADSLESLGFVVISAEDGERGLAALAEADPDLLLLDFAMPGMNGAEVADRARTLRPGLPIVFASGYSETAAIEAAVGQSATLLRKPFRVADLEATLRQALSDR